MSLLVFVVLGAVVGLLARALLPDRGIDSVGTVPASLAGSIAGGIFVSLLTGVSLVDVRSENIVGSLAGALAVLSVTLAAGRRVGA
jgi:uncharacterized membrane protein YeaQ/YmgE (transglycosylase-associated protein family)